MAENVMVEIPKGDPLRDAWEHYKTTDEYANTRNWAKHDAHVDGSLWGAFVEGWQSGNYATLQPSSEGAVAYDPNDGSPQDIQWWVNRLKAQERITDSLAATIARVKALADELEVSQEITQYECANKLRATLETK